MNGKDSSSILAICIALGLAGCGSSEKDDGAIKGWGFSNKGDISQTEPEADPQEEGPQYQQPTMDVLRGKLQKFPARYPIKRYPHGKVALVDVRPNRPPGYKNMVMMSTVDPLPQISNYYQQQLVSENWTKVRETRNSIYESVWWVKGDLECEVRVTPDIRVPGKQNVQLLCGRRRTNPKYSAPENQNIPNNGD